MTLHPVDIYVGQKLRTRRTLLGMSQEDLGNAVGVTFQQIQKYERGINRIGSSRLYDFATILKVKVAYFFEGYGEEGEEGSTSSSVFDSDDFSNKEVLSLVRSYYGINDQNVRKKVLSLIKSLSYNKFGDDEDDDDEDERSEASHTNNLAEVQSR